MPRPVETLENMPLQVSDKCPLLMSVQSQQSAQEYVCQVQATLCGGVKRILGGDTEQPVHKASLLS